MDLHHLIVLFSDQIKATPILEWVAIFFAVAEVLLARSNNVLLYPSGIISTVIYTYLFVRPSVKLYADAILNSYYFIMSMYGWLLWTKHSGNNATLPVTSCTKTGWTIVISLALVGWVLLYFLLTWFFPLVMPALFYISYTPSDVAVWDAFISATAWTGMWLLAKRKVENWLLLNVSNIVAIPVYIYKGMPFTAALTLFLFIVAIFGYLEWKKLYHLQQLKLQ